MPPKTLEGARNQPGRAEQIAEIIKRIKTQGINYVFFHPSSQCSRRARWWDVLLNQGVSVAYTQPA